MASPEQERIRAALAEVGHKPLEGLSGPDGDIYAGVPLDVAWRAREVAEVGVIECWACFYRNGGSTLPEPCLAETRLMQDCNRPMD